jgi:hypothetical protein
MLSTGHSRYSACRNSHLFHLMASKKGEVEITYEGWFQWIRVALFGRVYLGNIGVTANLHFDLGGITGRIKDHSFYIPLRKDICYSILRRPWPNSSPPSSKGSCQLRTNRNGQNFGVRKDPKKMPASCGICTIGRLRCMKSRYH